MKLMLVLSIVVNTTCISCEIGELDGERSQFQDQTTIFVSIHDFASLNLF